MLARRLKPSSFLVASPRLALVSALCACAARGATREGLSEAPAALPAPAAESMARPPRPLSEDGAFYVIGADAAHPRVRYLDGQASLNESCMIQLGNKLSRRVPPMYVNGQPLGFC